MQIELTKIGPIYQEGKTAKMEVEYVRDGKAAKRKLAAVGPTKDVMQALAKMAAGDVVEVKVEKDGEFYNWVKADKVEGTTAKPTSSTGKSTFETPEERARKQVYIVRQSSLATAVEYLRDQGKKYTPQEVLDVASIFAGFVFATNGEIRPMTAVGTADVPAETPKRTARVPKETDIQDDIPF